VTLLVYEVTKALPRDERYGLVPQMRRAAESVSANFVEGFKRRGIREKMRFYNVAEGSLEELKYFFILCQDLGYQDAIEELRDKSKTVGRLLNGMIRSTERRRA